MKGIGLYRRNGVESGGSERFLNKNCAAHGRSSSNNKKTKNRMRLDRSAASEPNEISEREFPQSCVAYQDAEP